MLRRSATAATARRPRRRRPCRAERAANRTRPGARDGWTAEQLQRSTPEQARALSVVAGWWDGRRARCRPYRRHRARRAANLFADLRAMAADHFTRPIQRAAAAARPLTSPDPKAIPYTGSAASASRRSSPARGMGDDYSPPPGAYAAVLDFDDPMLNPDYLLDIVNRVISLVHRQTRARPGATGPARPGVARRGRVRPVQPVLVQGHRRSTRAGGPATPRRSRRPHDRPS